MIKSRAARLYVMLRRARPWSTKLTRADEALEVHLSEYDLHRADARDHLISGALRCLEDSFAQLEKFDRGSHTGSHILPVVDELRSVRNRPDLRVHLRLLVTGLLLWRLLAQAHLQL